MRQTLISMKKPVYKFHPNTGLRRSNGVVAAAMRWYRWKTEYGALSINEAMAAKELVNLMRACQRLANFKVRSK